MFEYLFLIFKSFINNVLIFLELKSPPEILPTYHLPGLEFARKYKNIIHADVKFKPKERIQIVKAIQEWNLFCNGLIKLEVEFDYYNSKPNQYDSIIHRVKASHEIIDHFEYRTDSKILGLCNSSKNKTDIYIIYSRLYNDLTWKTVVLHEIGHLLGLAHTKGPSIMNKRNNDNPTTMNERDAIEFGKVFKVNHKDLIFAL